MKMIWTGRFKMPNTESNYDLISLTITKMKVMRQ